MEDNLYSYIINESTDFLAETSSNYITISERHLQAMWFEQKYFSNLTTFCGKSIVVISPGLWNGEAGPDFKKAHLLIDGHEVKGDVEIHLYEEDWYNHRH